MLEDGAKFFRIPILFPWLHAKYSKSQCYFQNDTTKNWSNSEVIH